MVDLPLWKIWTSIGRIIPYIWNGKSIKCSSHHQPVRGLVHWNHPTALGLSGATPHEAGGVQGVNADSTTMRQVLTHREFPGKFPRDGRGSREITGRSSGSNWWRYVNVPYFWRYELWGYSLKFRPDIYIYIYRPYIWNRYLQSIGSWNDRWGNGGFLSHRGTPQSSSIYRWIFHEIHHLAIGGHPFMETPSDAMKFHRKTIRCLKIEHQKRGEATQTWEIFQNSKNIYPLVN